MRRGLIISIMLTLLVWRAQAQESPATSVVYLPLVVRATGASAFTPTVTSMSVTPTRPACDPSYPNVCIPPPPPDLDCNRIIYRNFIVLPPDPHGFDGDHDGIGCEDVEGITPTSTPTATNSPTSTPTATNSPTPTSTQALFVTVVYRVEGAASKVTISYLDATGNEVTVPNATLPWRLQFSAAIDADLAVDAFGTNNEAVALSCAIDINGITLLTDQTPNAINGVACERFIN
jgi:hypothetical protein